MRYQLRVKGVPRRRLSTWFDGRQVTSAVNGQATAPMFAWVDLPPLASVVSVLVVPLLAELADPVAYLGDKADGDRRPRQGDEA